MVPPVNQTSGSLPPPSSQGSAGNIPTSSGSATANHQHQNAVSTTHTNGRVHPPLQERSRNARAQARHRAKRKAYISQVRLPCPSLSFLPPVSSALATLQCPIVKPPCIPSLILLLLPRFDELQLGSTLGPSGFFTASLLPHPSAFRFHLSYARP